MSADDKLFDPGGPQPAGGEEGGQPRPDFIQVQATVFRWADYDTPVWARANTNHGRWHRAGEGHSVQYWAYSPEAAWAESLRAQGIRERADVELMRSKIWVGQICAGDIADLTDPAWQSWLGLSAGELTGDDWSPCQDVANTLRGVGAGGVVVPSAALPGRLNLVVFKRMIRGDWVESPEGARKLRYPDLMIPCQLIARGRPPLNLVDAVNYRDELPGA